MPPKFTDDEIREAGRRAISEAGGDIARVTPGALRRLLGGGEPNANHARMIALLGSTSAPADDAPAATPETAALAAEIGAEVATLVEERVRTAVSARESELAASAERRVSHALRDAELAQKALDETRAAHDADVATLEAERDAARAEVESLRKEVARAQGRNDGLTAALRELRGELPTKSQKPKSSQPSAVAAE